MAKIHNYDRIVVYQRRSGWVCDLGPGSAMTPRYNPSEEYFDTAGGTKKPIARRRSLVIPVFDEDKVAHLRKMWREGCEMRAILIGKGAHLVWDLDSEFNMVEFGGEVGSISGANLIFDSDVFVGSVYQGEDLLTGIPWECETATDVSGTVYFPGPDGWTGSRFTAASGQSTDENGALSGAGTPQLEIHFPMQGLQFTLGGTFTGSLVTLDHSGATLTTNSKAVAGTDITGTIDSGTWKIQINVTAATTRPKLTVTSAGSLASDRVGECVDCSDLTAEAASAPSWSS